MLISPALDVPFLLAPVVAVAVTIAVVWVAVATVVSTVVSIPGVSLSLGLSSRSRGSFGLSRPLAIDSVVASVGVAIVSTVVPTIVSKTISTVVSIPGVSFSLGLSLRGSFSFSRPLAIDSVVGVAIVSTVVSNTISTVVSVPGVSFRGSLHNDVQDRS